MTTFLVRTATAVALANCLGPGALLVVAVARRWRAPLNEQGFVSTCCHVY